MYRYRGVVLIFLGWFLGACSLPGPPIHQTPTQAPPPTEAGTGPVTPTQPPSPPAATPQEGAVETQVQYILALEDLVMYGGPGEGFPQIGQVFGGQVALVTGASGDGQWWRVICPNDEVGDCWVTADPQRTQPVEPLPTPGEQPTLAATPTEGSIAVQETEVQYVLALQDTPIYSGPGYAYPTLGQISGGQTARVTGVSADGGWWRVACPDASEESCWVRAGDPGARPAVPPG